MHWRRKWQPTPVCLPGEFHGLYSAWGCKELDTNEQLSPVCHSPHHSLLCSTLRSFLYLHYWSVFYSSFLNSEAVSVCLLWESSVYSLEFQSVTKTWLLLDVYHQMGAVVKAEITSAVLLNPATHPESKEN